MKTILKLSALILFVAFISGGCNKEETKLYYTGGTKPALSAVPASDTMSYANADNIVLTLNWTNPDYTFTTGVSSLDVTYSVQVDAVGGNFSNPYTTTVSKDLSYSFTASALNDIMQNQLNLAPAMQHTLEMRVVSSLTNNSAQLASNVVQYVATPYVIPPKVAPPSSGALFITGSATDGGWMVGGGVGVPANQQFTKIDDLHFTITLHLLGGQEYLFVPVNGDWTHKYACKDKTVQSPGGGDFGADLSDNFPGPAADGTYEIDVDFQKGKYTVTKK
jgi:hypothetical protein